MIFFIIPDNPVPQARPRFFRRGSFVGTYQPPECLKFKQKVALFANQANVPMVDYPVFIKIVFYLERPKRYMRKKDSEKAMPCTSRPDCDNLAKGVLDGLNGIAYKDDSQVYKLEIEKWYHEKSGNPRTEITII